MLQINLMPRDLSPREELLKIQKKIFVQNDELIRGQAVIQERGFESYERDYKRQVRDFSEVSTIDEMIAAVQQADIVYLGDYHTNKQSQRMLLRILKLLVEKTSQFAIGLELVHRHHQKILEDYLGERITEETFLKKIQFKKYWYFDLWENFRPIFEFARYWKIPLFGIESSLSGEVDLNGRDDLNAALIASLIRKDPARKWIFFVGDLHLAPSHLPNKVLRSLHKTVLKDLILYQNSESIYWRLAEKEMEEKTEIVRIDPRSFCILNTPPIVWQQSYLNWLEHEGGGIDYADAKHSFLTLVDQIAAFLGIEPAPAKEEVEVFTCGDLSFLKRLREDGGFSKKEIRQIKKQILSSESYCIPQKKYIYLANLSLNHSAEEAAHFLKYLCSGAEFPRDPVDAFYANAIHEALGFFGSKIINHKRKCFHEKEYQRLVDYLRSEGKPRQRRLQLETALLILDHKRRERRGLPILSQRFFRSHPDLFFGVTHGLGYILGDKMYYALLLEKITKEEIRDLFHDPMKGEGRPYEIYRALLKRVQGVKIPKRV